MAFITPKTDWSSVDGVRDTDFNRIEGNILELYNMTGARSDLYIYVDASTGSDDTGNGTAANPYRTISKALSVLPHNLEGKDVAISIAGGTYNEDVTIRGFDAPLTLTNGGEEVTINGLRVDGCHCSLGNNIRVKTSGPVWVVNCGTLTGSGSLHTNGSYVSLNYGALVALAAVRCDNSPGFAVSADMCSRFYAANLDGDGNASGLAAQGGSVIAFGDTNIEANSPALFTALGGRIYTGAQASVLNY